MMGNVLRYIVPYTEQVSAEVSIVDNPRSDPGAVSEVCLCDESQISEERRH